MSLVVWLCRSRCSLLWSCMACDSHCFRPFCSRCADTTGTFRSTDPLYFSAGVGDRSVHHVKDQRVNECWSFVCTFKLELTAATARYCAQVTTLLATSDEAGLVLIYRISSSPDKLDTKAGDSQDYCGYDAGIPNIYRPVARCGPVVADGSAGTKGDGVARLAWVGSVLYTASDAGIVQRGAMDL